MSTIMFILAFLFYPQAADGYAKSDPHTQPVVQQLQLEEWMYYSCDDGAPLYARYFSRKPHQYVEIQYDSGPRIRLDSTTNQFGPHFTDGDINFLRKSYGATLTDENGHLINECLL